MDPRAPEPPAAALARRKAQEELVMTRRSNLWLVLAFLFSLVNVFGAWWAVAHGELLHTGAHVGLLVLTAYAVRRLVARREAAY
jgi:hypothetical protein